MGSYQLFAFQGRNLIEIMKFLTIFGLFLLANLTQSLQFDCPESSGIFSDPDDCQCIYECASDVPYQICCGEGTLWDEDSEVCDYGDSVDCGDRPRPDGTTKPTTSTSTEKTTSTSTDKSTMTTSGTVPTTTSSSLTSSSYGSSGMPDKVIGMYILLADDFEEGFETDSDWEPKLYPYQQEGANVLFFTFINPESMTIPKSFKKLAASRGTGEEGSVPADTKIIFAIGGYAYSVDPNPWDWLTTREKAEEMAVEVAGWRNSYGIDGIDLDIEAGAGDKAEAGPNLVHFIRKLKSLQPGLVVSQPSYGYPQVKAEIDVINASWNVGGSSNGLAESVGIMVYEGTQSLQYVKNFAQGSSQWEGFPITVDVPTTGILVGCKGSSRQSDIMTLASESIKQDLLGMMVWFCSVQGGLQYESSWDCSGSEESSNAYVEAMKYLNANS